MDDLQAEATELLQALLRVDTSNPPGGETPAALVLQEYLESHGVACELVARDPARANLVARIAGTGDGPSLALLGHLDVVPADGQWVHPPFSGHLDADGFVWGRGAADMKNEVATRAVVLAALVREGFRPRGDLWFVAVSDEEDGLSDVGASWLVRERPDLAVDYVLNEGGAERLELPDGRRVVTVTVGEKAASVTRVTALGTPTASVVAVPGEGAVVRLARLVERIDAYRPRPRLAPATQRLLEVLLRRPVGDLAADLAQATALHPAFAELVAPLFATTYAPTVLHGSEALNVVPARASVDVDTRTAPGTTLDDIRAELAEALGDDVPHEVTFPTEVMGGSSSPFDTPFTEALAGVLAETDPGSVLVPTVLNGFTDSHWFREAFGSRAYGFWPTRTTPYDVVRDGVHGNDERIHVDDLGYATDVQLRLCRALLG